MLGALDCWDSVGEGDLICDIAGEVGFPLRFVVCVFSAAYLDLCLVLVGLRPVGRFQYVCAPKSLSTFNASNCSLNSSCVSCSICLL